MSRFLNDVFPLFLLTRIPSVLNNNFCMKFMKTNPFIPLMGRNLGSKWRKIGWNVNRSYEGSDFYFFRFLFFQNFIFIPKSTPLVLTQNFETFWLKVSNLEIFLKVWNEEISFQKVQISEEGPTEEWKDWTGETFSPNVQSLFFAKVTTSRQESQRSLSPSPSWSSSPSPWSSFDHSSFVSIPKRPFTKLDRVVFLHVTGFGWVSWTNENRLNRMRKGMERERTREMDRDSFWDWERKRKKLREKDLEKDVRGLISNKIGEWNKPTSHSQHSIILYNLIKMSLVHLKQDHTRFHSWGINYITMRRVTFSLRWMKSK